MTKHIRPGEEVLNRVKRACAKIAVLQGEGFTPSEAARRAKHEGFCNVRAETEGFIENLNGMPGYVAFEIEAVMPKDGELYRCRVTYYLPAKGFKREVAA